MGGRLTSLLFKQTPTHILFTLPQGGKKTLNRWRAWLPSLLAEIPHAGTSGLRQTGEGVEGREAERLA